MQFGNLQGTKGPTRDNIPILLENPLGHFTALSLGLSENNPYNLFIEGKTLLVLPIVAPLVPAILLQVRDITLSTHQRGVVIVSMKLEVVLGNKVIDSCPPFKAVVQKY